MLVLLSPLTSRKMSDSITERSIEINTSGPYHRSINNNYNLSLYHTESELTWCRNVPLTKITDFVRKHFSGKYNQTFLWQELPTLYIIVSQMRITDFIVKRFSNDDYQIWLPILYRNVSLTRSTDFIPKRFSDKDNQLCIRKRFSDEDHRLITETFLWQDYFIIQKRFSNEDYRLYSEMFL